MHVGMAAFFQNPGNRLSDHAVYRHETAMADLAEPLGFDSIWSAERTDCAALIGIFSYGGMPHDLARANITLFAERVLPRLQRLDAGCDFGGVRPAA